MGGVGEVLNTGFCNQHIVLCTDTAISGEIQAGFHRKYHAGFQHSFIADDNAGTLVDLQADTVTQATQCVVIQTLPQENTAVSIFV